MFWVILEQVDFHDKVRLAEGILNSTHDNEFWAGIGVRAGEGRTLLNDSWSECFRLVRISNQMHMTLAYDLMGSLLDPKPITWS